MPKLSLDALTDLAARGLKKAGASRSMAQATARALVAPLPGYPGRTSASR